MNEKLLELLKLMKIFNGGEIDRYFEECMKVFADYHNGYEIETISDLVDVMKEDISNWDAE
jgi:hypothetical protein